MEPDQTQEGDATPSPSRPTLHEEVVNFLNSEIGKAILEQHAEKRFTHIVRRRWKIYGFPIIVIIGFLAWWGWDTRGTLKTAESEIDSLNAVVKVFRDSAEQYLNKFETQNESLGRSVTNWQEFVQSFEGANNQISQDQRFLALQSGNLYRGLIETFQTQAKGLQGKIDTIESTSNGVKNLFKQMTQYRDTLPKVQASFKAEFENFMKQVETELNASETQITFENINESIENLRSQQLGTSFQFPFKNNKYLYVQLPGQQKLIGFKTNNDDDEERTLSVHSPGSVAKQISISRSSTSNIWRGAGNDNYIAFSFDNTSIVLGSKNENNGYYQLALTSPNPSDRDYIHGNLVFVAPSTKETISVESSGQNNEP